MCVDRNISFLCTEVIISIFKKIFSDSKLLGKVTLSRHKITAIVKEVIAPAQKKRLAEILRNNQFSVMIDESTDISKYSFYCVVTRIADNDQKKIIDTLWDIVPAAKGPKSENKKSDADFVFNSVMNTFKEAEIPSESIIGFCSDTCNLMMGKCNSVSTRLKLQNPDMAITKCICHLESLILNGALLVFPEECIKLTQKIHNYIMCSAKRVQNWCRAQEMCEVQPRMILGICWIRWLSLYACIRQFLRRLTPLLVFFENESKEDEAAAEIFKQLKDPAIIATYKFILTTIGRLVCANEVFQSEKPVVSKISHLMIEVYKDLLKMYMKEDYIENSEITEIDPYNKEQFKPLHNMFIGVFTERYLNNWKSKKLDDDEELHEDFLTVCRKFVTELCNGIKERCNLKNSYKIFCHPEMH